MKHYVLIIMSIMSPIRVDRKTSKFQRSPNRRITWADSQSRPKIEPSTGIYDAQANGREKYCKLLREILQSIERNTAKQIPGWPYIEPSTGIYDAQANGRSGQIYARQARMAAQLPTNELSRENKSWTALLLVE